ncbi:MAG TPA: hypothetical protein VE978_19600 [Chitinophagales bacterium]|nr:hypothetical protein [Chitinophagales bacterium]
MKKYFLASLLLCIQSTLFAQAGMLDSTFGINGKANISYVYSTANAQDIAATKDGKILVLTDYYLVRMNSDGTVDSTFADPGKLCLGCDFSGDPKAIAVDDSNRIIFVSTEWYYFDHKMHVYRFLPDGTIDTTFNGGNDVAMLPFQVNRALLIESDGRILIGGQNDDGYNVATLTRINTSGDFDPAFNLSLDLSESFIYAIAEQTDGKVLAAGSTDSDCFIIRVLPNGSIDSLFGNNGFVIVDDGNSETAQSISILPDGKILAAGHSDSTLSSKIMCWRFQSDGSPDSSFGNNGEIILYSGSKFNRAWFVFSQSDSTAIIGTSLFDGVHTAPSIFHLNYDGSIDSSYGDNGVGGKTFLCGHLTEIAGDTTADGRLLTCGTAYDLGNDIGAVSKLMNDGAEDSTFSGGGTSTFVTNDSMIAQGDFYGFVSLPNGKIFCAAGANLMFIRLTADGAIDSSYGVNGFYLPNQQLGGYHAMMALDSDAVYVIERSYPGFVIFKFQSDGTVDSSFGIQGIKEYPVENYGGIEPVDFIIQPGHKLLIAMTDPMTSNYLSLMRFNANGAIDSSFADDGKQTFNDGYSSNARSSVAVSADGKIMFAYDSDIYGETEYGHLYRLLPDGTFDSTFDGTGAVTYLLPIQVNFYYHRLLIQSDGKVIICGYHDNIYESEFVRVNEDGSLDSLYGIDGALTIPGIGSYYSVLLQSDDELLISQDVWPNYSAGIYRYLADGIADSSFGDSAIAVISDMASGNEHEFPMQIQSDGKILVAGHYASGGNYSGYIIARLFGEGTVSVNSIENKNDLFIFPNPVTDHLIISCSSG